MRNPYIATLCLSPVRAGFPAQLSLLDISRCGVIAILPRPTS
jgi:hypothetical protein